MPSLHPFPVLISRHLTSLNDVFLRFIIAIRSIHSRDSCALPATKILAPPLSTYLCKRVDSRKHHVILPIRRIETLQLMAPTPIPIRRRIVGCIGRIANQFWRKLAQEWLQSGHAAADDREVQLDNTPHQRWGRVHYTVLVSEYQRR